jgi:acetyl/propionyl-CoA carboxylase alpha subunit
MDRVDAGVYEGGEVSVFYDPLISKLVTWGPTRDECIKSMSYALDTYQIEVRTSSHTTRNTTLGADTHTHATRDTRHDG